MDYIKVWEDEKRTNLLEAFTRVMQGEPADGGNSREETRDYLIEFAISILKEQEKEVEKLEFWKADINLYSYKLSLQSKIKEYEDLLNKK